MRTLRYRHLLAGALAAALYASPGGTQVSTKYIDLTAGAGYSSNPFLRATDAEGSFFGRLSARGVYSLRGERSTTSLSGFVEGSTYFKEYGLTHTFAVDGSHSREVSETLSMFASAGATGDIGGQLGNRFLSVPPVVEGPGGIPGLPPSIEDDEQYTLEGRQYRYYGQGGLTARLNDRSSVTASAGGSRNTFTQDNVQDFTTIFTSASYNRLLSERTTLGFNVFGSRSNYDDSSDTTTVVNPSVSLSTQLNESLYATGSIGVSLARTRVDGVTDTSTDLSFSGSLCRRTESESLCGAVARNTQASPTVSSMTVTSATADWFKKLDEKQTIQMSASFTRNSSDQNDPALQTLGTSQLRAAASYSRLISPRLSVGTDAGMTAVRRPGDDPRANITGSFFVRYRLGDLR